MKIQVTMQLDRETKNTYLFKELDSTDRPIENLRDTKIGTLYVKQSQFAGRPDKIRVTVDDSPD